MLNTLEQRLADLFPGYSPMVTGRGLTALVAGLAAVAGELGTGEVILPSTVCPSLALGALYAGLTPRFCDVEPDNLCLSARTLAPCLNDRTRAVVVVYLFGKTLDIETLSALVRARTRGALLIEDLAQAIGGRLAGRPLGSFGDMAVLSFSDAKVVPGAAGALLARDPGWAAAARRAHECLPPGGRDNRVFGHLARSFRDLTHGLYGAMRSAGLVEATRVLEEMVDHYRPIYAYQEPVGDAVAAVCDAGLCRLEESRQARQALYSLYARNLDDKVNYIRFAENETCWRLPVVLADFEQQLEAIETLRAAGQLVSDHYFPAAMLFGATGLAVSREIGLRVVNFWVDGKTPASEVPRICEVVNRLGRKRRGQWPTPPPTGVV